MSDLGKVVRGVVALCIAAGLGTLIGWLASQKGAVAPVSIPVSASQPLAVAQPPPTVEETTPLPPLHGVSRHKAGQSDAAQQIESDGVAPWEQALDDILLGDDDENGKADKILALIPNAPPEAKQELAQHLVNMVQDDHYDGTAQMLTNAATPVEVSDVLMNDLLNRNNGLKLPMLLAIARNPDHPLKDQALDLLGLLTQEDDGTNWDQWNNTVNTWLQNNPP